MRGRRVLGWVLGVLWLGLAADGWAEERRVALVVGIQNYEIVAPLRSGLKEAQRMGEVLREARFEVELLEDATRQDLQLGVERLVRRAGPDGVALFYFVGQGMSLGETGENYLLPREFFARTVEEVEAGAYRAAQVRSGLEGRGGGLNILVLDVFKNLSHEASQDWAEMSGGPSTFIASSVADNLAAEEAVFTKHWVAAMRHGLELEDVFKGASEHVRRESLPWPLLQRGGNHSGAFRFFSPVAQPTWDWDPPPPPPPPSRPAPVQGEVETVLLPGDVPLELVWVEAGQFEMGCSDGDPDCQDDEKPRHPVSVDGFWIGRTEVTNAQFEAFVQATGYRTTAEKEGRGGAFRDGKYQYLEGLDWRHPLQKGVVHGGASDPVLQISWDDAQAFTRWLSSFTYHQYRLPTEAEWEYAARAGSSEARYGALQDVAWFGDNSGTSPLDATALVSELGQPQYFQKLRENGNKPHAVGQKQANRLGLHDMLGNALEWCQNSYDKQAYSKPEAPPKNLWGGGDSVLRVFRGGSWNALAKVVRASFRNAYRPSSRLDVSGFRVVRLDPR